MQKHVEVTSLTPGNIVGALSMRVSADGRSGLVTLRDVDLSPEISVPATGNTFFVNVFTDNTGSSTDTINATRCTSGEPPSNPCTLRDAITYANQDASGNISAGKSDTIMLPVGTYSLTWQKGILDANANGVTHLEILGPVSIIGEGPAGGVIIDAQNNDTAFTINPGPFGSFNPSGDSYIFDTAFTNLVIQNATNNNNINAVNATGDTNNVGGALNWDAFGTGNLTLTNSKIQNCTIKWGAGGGIWAENSTGGGTGKLTLTGSSILNNKTPEQGGGVYMAFPPAAMAAMNTTISNNTAEPSVNLGDPGGEGSGGGVFLNERTGSPATPQTTLTGVTISSNATTVDGGGIFTNTGMILTTSLVKSNSAGRWGGGVFVEEATDSINPQVEVQSTITSTNILSNSATTTGGGIAVGPDNPNGGNSLQISLSRIVGNTSGGTTGLGTVSPGTAMATNNWWGCNAGPGNPGCDSAGSGATFSPWAQFILKANPTTVNLGSNIALAVSLNTNSASASIPGAFPAVANDTFTYSLAGLSASSLPNSGTFDSGGKGSATLTPSTAGTGIISAKFDNQTSSVNLTVNATSTSLAISPSSPAYSYGAPPSIRVQLSPAGATGITASDFTVTVDNSSSIGGSSFGLTLISNNNYQLTGPFNLVSPGGHTLKVSFAGTGSFQANSTSVTMTVSKNTVTFSDVITPIKPVQEQGGSVQEMVVGMGTGAAPSGTLSFAFDSGAPASVALSGGSANIIIPTIITPGSHTLHITYGGDANYAPATTTITLAIEGKSQTVIASATPTTATIDVFGLGFTPPSGQLAFTDVTAGSPVAAPVTLNTATAIAALTPQVTTSTGANTLPDWTTVGDVNGDGKQDLVASLFQTDSVSVQLGNGDGTFQPATTTPISAGFGPAEAHLVSLRGNGVLDLIVGSFNQNQIAVLLGDGHGAFGVPAFYSVGTAGNTPTSLTTGDFNNDGSLDVAVANTSDNTVSILLGNGLGALTPSGPAISVGHTPEAIRAGDFNDDGFSDLAVANYHDGTVTTLLNNKNGTFTATVHSVGTGAGSGPQALATHGAGTGLQLAVANFKDNTVSVFNSNGDGTFGAQTIVNVGKGPDDLSFADFNGDGIQDLVVANYTDGTVDLLLGAGGGSYTLSGPFKVGNNPYSAAVGDINLDGTPDILVANTFGNNTGVLLGGTEIAVQYSGLSLTAGHTLNATYNPDGASSYGSSTSPGVTAP
jgi:CSLREA domain-containing protein